MSDALERLRKRQRPTVPARDISLISGSQDTSTSRNLDLHTSGHEENEGETSSKDDSERSLGTSMSGYLETSNRSKMSSGQEDKTSSDEVSQTSISSGTSTPGYLDIERTEAAIQPLATKQSTLRLEANLSDRLQSMCREHNICREVLLEAMFEHCEANQEALKQILVAAQEKNEHRQQIANLKRAQSMMKRFGQISS